jgi:hypothetical protein
MNGHVNVGRIETNNRRIVMGKQISLYIAMLCVGAAAMAGEAPPGPPVHKQSGINYVSGGIGEEGRKAMASVAAKYPIQLIFNVEGEPDASGVKVTLRDLNGDTLISAVSEGPYFFMNPVGGRYTFDVEYKGQKESKTKDAVGRRYLVLEFNFAAEKK